MSRDGSDWDYINEHMGGHDSDGMPNFMHREPAGRKKTNKKKITRPSICISIIENFITRLREWEEDERQRIVEFEESPTQQRLILPKLTITDIELEALKCVHRKVSDRKHEEELLLLKSLNARIETSESKRTYDYDSVEVFQIRPTQVEVIAIEKICKNLKVDWDDYDIPF